MDRAPQGSPQRQPRTRYGLAPDARVVVTTNAGAPAYEIVSQRLGLRQPLTPTEHNVLAMVQQGMALEDIAARFPGELPRRLCERLVGMKLLVRMGVARTFLPDDRPRVAAGVRFQRSEKPGIIFVYPPGLEQPQELREVEAIIAHSLDGQHTVVDIMEAARLKGVPATLDTMLLLLKELDGMGLIERTPVDPLGLGDLDDVDIPLVQGTPGEPAAAAAPPAWQSTDGAGLGTSSPIEQKLDALRSLSLEKEERGGAWKTWAVAVVLAGLVGGVGYLEKDRIVALVSTTESPVASFSPSASATPGVASRPVVQTVQAESTGNAVVMAAGYIAARDPITLGVTVGGRVVSVDAENGALVKKGQVLVQLDDAEARAQIALARAKRNDAERQLQRARTLLASQAATQADLDRALGTAEIARAEVAVHAQRLEQAKIRSPINKATILEVLVRPGEVLAPTGSTVSAGVVKLADLSRLVAEVDVNEADIFKLFVGQKAEIVPDSLSRKYQGAVLEIAQEADRARGTVQVKVDLKVPDRSLRPGNSVKASFQPDGATRLLIPRTAVDAGKVWVIDEAGAARLRAIAVRAAGGDRVEVTSGLTTGERIVVSGLAGLRDGQKVE